MGSLQNPTLLIIKMSNVLLEDISKYKPKVINIT